MKQVLHLIICLMSLAAFGCAQRVSPHPLRPATAAEIAKLTHPRENTVAVHIVTGNYTGGYHLDGDQAQLFGAATYYLELGVHTFDIVRTGVSSFTFLVNIDGTVSNISNSVAAKASGSSLILNNVKVDVMPGEYGRAGGVCELVSHPPHPHQSPSDWITARKTFDLIPGLEFALDTGLRIGAGGYLSYFYFLVDEKGVVHPESSVSAVGGPGVLQLNTGFIVIGSSDSGSFYVGAANKPIYSGAVKAKAPVILGLVTCIRRSDSADPGYFTADRENAESGRVEVGSVKYRWQLLPGKPE